MATALPVIKRFPTARIGSVGNDILEVVRRAPMAAKLQITSGMDGNHGAVSWHYGMDYNGSPAAALDIAGLFAGDSATMAAFAKWCWDKFPDQIIELIHTTPFADNGFYVWHGQKFLGPPAGNGGPYASLLTSPDPNTNHSNHVHLSMSRAQCVIVVGRLAAQSQPPTVPPVTPPPTTPGSVQVPNVMQVWASDLSDHDYSRGPVDLRSFRTDGISVLIAKATEGSDWTSPHFGQTITSAKQNAFPVMGAYHVLWPGDPLADARHFFDVVNRAAPWWVSVPWVWMTDAEQFDGMPRKPSVTEISTFIGELRRLAAGRGWYPGYLPRHTYGDTIPAGLDIWESDYRGSGSPRPFRQQYAGVTGQNWAPRAGRKPKALQFAEDATIGTQPRCDISLIDSDLHGVIRLCGKTPVSEPPPVPPVKPPTKPTEALKFTVFIATGRQTWKQVAQTYQTGDIDAKTLTLRRDNGGATSVRPAAGARIKVRQPHRLVVIVKSGDTLSAIASRAQVSLSSVIALNRHNFPNPDVIDIGDPVRIS